MTRTNHALLPALLLFVVALLVRLFHAGEPSLWLDEGNTWQMIQQGWGTLLLELFNPVSAYPLYHVLLKAWVALAGDSEWALRFPSVLAGAAAVAALYAAATELQRAHRDCEYDCNRDDNRMPAAPPALAPFPLAASLLLLVSPFAVWYAQEAKVYSLFLLVATLHMWGLVRALRHQTKRAWLIYGAIAITSVFLHRLAVLLIVAAYVALRLTNARRQQQPHAATITATWVPWLAFALIGVGIVAAMALGLGSEGASTGAHIPAGPGLALWLTVVRFSLDRGPGEFPWWWLLPWATLMVWGGATLVRDAWVSRLRNMAVVVLLCVILVPLLLFLVQLVYTRFYETRYLMQIFPAWVLVLAYPAIADGDNATPTARRIPYRRLLYWLLVVAAVGSGTATLVQPGKGLFSGDPVKEQYRDIFEVLAQRVHPDDVVVLHPAYLEPLYTYYMGRLTTDPPPAPALFLAFKQGQTEFTRKDWDAARKETFAGHVRSFLVIAPDHARTIDIPNAVYNDEYGMVGIYYQYSREEKKWPCGIWRLNGVHMYCQESPEAYVTGEVPTPATPLHAQFGDHLLLRGYTLKPTIAGRPGVYRAGGSIPISLYWEVTQQIPHDYHVFLHLCRDCDLPPPASHDGQPLEGYLPTSTWLPRKPARDDRAVPLPPDLPPGRYSLVLGLYDPANPAPEARVPVTDSGGARVLEHHRLVLGTVEVMTTP